MKLTSKDIRTQEFEKVLRGYDPSDVRAFLNVIAQEWDHAARRLNMADASVHGAALDASPASSHPAAVEAASISAENALVGGVRVLIEQRRELLHSLEDRLISMAESLEELKRGQDALHALLDDIETRRDAMLRELSAAAPEPAAASSDQPDQLSDHAPAAVATASPVHPSNKALIDQILLDLD